MHPNKIFLFSYLLMIPCCTLLFVTSFLNIISVEQGKWLYFIVSNIIIFSRLYNSREIYGYITVNIVRFLKSLFQSNRRTSNLLSLIREDIWPTLDYFSVNILFSDPYERNFDNHLMLLQVLYNTWITC